MIYYVLLIMTALFSFIECFCKITNTAKKFLLSFLIIILSIMSTIRANIAGDYYIYKDSFLSMDINNISNILNPLYQPYELLYGLLMYVSKVIIEDYTFFCFIEYLVVALLQYKTITYWCDKCAVIHAGRRYTYILSAYFFLWCVGKGDIFVIRQTISLWIFLYATRYIIEKNMKNFILCVIIASFFHISALISLLAWPAYKYNGTNIKKVVFFVLLTVLFSAFINDIFYSLSKFLPSTIIFKVALYFQNTYVENDTIIIRIVKVLLNSLITLVFCYMILKSRNAKEYWKNINISGIINIYLLGIVLYVGTVSISQDIARIASYFIMMQYAIFIAFFKQYVKIKSKRGIWFWALLVIYLSVRFTYNIYSTEDGVYIPFDTIF